MKTEVPTPEMVRRAESVVHAHFKAVTDADEPKVRATLYTPPLAAGKPFSVYFAGMRSLAPIRVASVKPLLAYESKGPPAHTTVEVEIVAETTGGQRSGRLVVWLLADGRDMLGQKMDFWFMGSPS
jgi:hypothetical protein